MIGLRRLAGASLASAALLASPVVLPWTSAEAVTAGSLAVSRSSGMPGESLTVTVTSLPGPAIRSVRLDRCVGYASSGSCSSWVPVMSGKTSSHKIVFGTIVHAMATNRYRAVAAKTSTSGEVITPSKPVDGTQQGAAVVLPTTAAVGDTVDVGLTLSPVRSGRQLALQQRNDDGTWTTIVSSLPSDADGQATTPLTFDTAGTFTYRTVAQTWDPAGRTLVGWFPSFPSTVVVS